MRDRSWAQARVYFYLNVRTFIFKNPFHSSKKTIRCAWICCCDVFPSGGVGLYYAIIFLWWLFEKKRRRLLDMEKKGGSSRNSQKLISGVHSQIVWHHEKWNEMKKRQNCWVAPVGSSRGSTFLFFPPMHYTTVCEYVSLSFWFYIEGLLRESGCHAITK